MRSKYLVGAITGSLVLHLAVFWPQPDSLSPSAPSHILFAQLGQVPTPIAAPNTTLEHSLRPAKSPSAPDPRQRSGTNETRVPTKASVPREVVRRSSEPSARSSGPNDVSGGAPVPGGDAVAERLRAVAPDERSGAADGISLVRYRLAVAAAAVRLQQDEMAGQGLNGTAIVEIRRSVGTAGLQVRIAQSSGVDEVDKMALALLTRAARVVSAAIAGPSPEGPVRFPVVFGPGGS